VFREQIVCSQEEDQMGTAKSTVELYRDCIREKQLIATRLSIEIGMKAQENDDADELVETMDCLDTAIDMLEDAKAAGDPTRVVIAGQRAANLASQPQRLMDDLGHSMASMDMAQPHSRVARAPREVPQAPDHLEPSVLDWPGSVSPEDSLRFFA